jgi:anti-sigma factor RsiW
VNCEGLDRELDAFVEGTLEPTLVSQVEAHLAVCDRCRALVGDLHRILAQARSLPQLQPPPMAWHGIRVALGADHLPLAPAASGRRERPSWHWRGLAVAAMLFLAVATSLYFVGGSRWRASQLSGSPTTVSNTADADADPLGTVEEELAQAAAHYEKAITGLERVANAADTSLDPETMATLRTNLGVVDKAIEDSRRALRAQPTSEVAQTSLLDAFRRKVTLLQNTLTLMNEMRQGNAAGATRAVESFNKG